MSLSTTDELQAMLNVSECGHPGPWAKNQAGAIVDAQGCEVITAWDGTASINLAVLRNPTDEDVERARAAASECWNPGGFLPEPPYTTVEARACIDAFLGGGEV
jgi:hypothetical protein